MTAPVDAFRQQLEASLAATSREAECRLRALIAQHDRLKDALRDVTEQIGIESRKYADANGLTVRPTIEQLRTQLARSARPRR